MILRNIWNNSYHLEQFLVLYVSHYDIKRHDSLKSPLKCMKSLDSKQQCLFSFSISINFLCADELMLNLHGQIFQPLVML